ncbi:MAG: HAMP domain-containing histidine kinase, partial [Lachnospiraceae bacterium]|nr:HAMP domain-containing histidine kinase [Lachnospiraceae bacterium]
MFRKTERKIVVVVMAFLVLLLGGTLAVIYLTSYRDTYTQNQAMLELYVTSYAANGNPSEEDDRTEAPEDGGTGREGSPEGEALPEGNESPGRGETGLPEERDPEVRGDVQSYLLSTFYSVAFSEEETSVDNGNSLVYTDDELTEVAAAILEKEQTEGVYGNLIYRVAEGDGYSLVALMDNTLVAESFTSLFRNALLFGGIACLISLLLIILLARWIVKPLRENHESQKQFISDAGHELKTPVAAIQANAEILSRETGENRWLSNIQHENERMARVVSQLLELSRTEHVPAARDRVNVSRIVQGETLAFEAVFFEREAALSLEMPEQDVFIRGDEAQLGELISILLDNAVEHTGAGGMVRVCLRAGRGRMTLLVTNPGPEIPREEREKIFRRFYRSDEARNSEGGHYGLGLAIARA